jgi:TRAP-type mannitol/chloroaromatic compound transport system substrate-binding protein
MGFDEIAKYYYTPGWHEPGTNLEIILNKEKFEELSEPFLKDFRLLSKKYKDKFNLKMRPETPKKNTTKMSNAYMFRVFHDTHINRGTDFTLP